VPSAADVCGLGRLSAQRTVVSVDGAVGGSVTVFDRAIGMKRFAGVRSPISTLYDAPGREART
jgi:hypothetical protein